MAEIIRSIPELAHNEVITNASDDFMNLIEITIRSKEEDTEADEAQSLGIQIMNKHCYIPSLINDEPMVRRSVELAETIVEHLFDCELVQLDQ